MPAHRPQAILTFTTQPQRILLVLPSWVGDVVMATPLIRSVFERFPDAQITLLISRQLHALLQGSPWVQHCSFWSPGDKSSAAKEEYQDLLTELRALQFDLAVILPNSLRSAWLCLRAGAQRRVGYARDGRSLLLTDPLAVPNRIRGVYEPMPLVEYYAVLAQALGCENPGDQLTLYTTLACDEALAQRLAGEGVEAGSRPLVVLCPGANSSASRGWDPGRFAATADFLIRRRGALIVISPGPGEEAEGDAVRRAMSLPAVLLTQPVLGLGELKSLIARSDLLLGNDTGPRQIARAFSIPQVTVFGPTDQRWTHIGHDREVIVRVDVPCGPCGKKKCPLEEQVCMTGISVDMVCHACEDQLAAAHSRRQALDASTPR